METGTNTEAVGQEDKAELQGASKYLTTCPASLDPTLPFYVMENTSMSHQTHYILLAVEGSPCSCQLVLVASLVLVSNQSKISSSSGA